MEDLHQDLNEINDLLNDFEEHLADTDNYGREINSYLDMMHDGFEHIETLLDIHSNMDENETNEVALETINIYLTRTFNSLGLEDSAMVAVGEPYDSSEKAKEKKEGLWNKIVEMFKRLIKSIVVLFRRIATYISEHFNILFLYIEKFVNGYKRMLEKLPENNHNIYSKQVVIKSGTLGKYFHITNGKKLVYRDAFKYGKELELILKINTALFEGLTRKDKIMNGSDIKVFVEKTENVEFVQGITFELDNVTGLSIIHGKGKPETEFEMITPENKKELIDLNNLINSTSKDFFTQYVKNSYLSQANKIISHIYDDEKFIKKTVERNKNRMNEENIRMQMKQLKEGTLMAAHFMKYLFFIAIQTYRAEIKYMHDTLKEMHKLNKATS